MGENETSNITPGTNNRIARAWKYFLTTIFGVFDRMVDG